MGVTRGTFQVMRARTYGVGWPAPLAMAIFVSGFASAHGGEASYCVTCQGPDRTYLCRITGEEVSPSDALKLYCVVRTAKEGGHTSCGARNTGVICNGIEKTYSYNGPSIPDDLAEDPRVKEFEGRIEKSQQASDKDDKRKSLVEVTGEALSASRRGWRNMRDSINGRYDAHQSPAQSGSTPSYSMTQDPSPKSPHGTTALPLSAASQPNPPPEHKRGVRSFARNTYRCVRSLFRRCGTNAEAQGPN
jgi:hypothetical protein